jgi:hypothetical protein
MFFFFRINKTRWNWKDWLTSVMSDIMLAVRLAISNQRGLGFI